MIVEGFYKLLALIDWLVYSLASTMISVNMDIAGKEIFRADQISDFATRVYIVVGVLMLFKIVISAIQYMINPDAFDDKDKGLTGLLKKTIISIGLMVLAPAIFNFMVEIQDSIVESIPSLVFGSEVQSDTQSTADQMTFTVLSSFIKPNEGKGGSVGDGGEIHDLESFKSKAAEGCGGGVVGDAKNCKYNYMILISTLSGAFLCYVLMSMTLDVAIRTIKFSIIRILAPIPISSYIFSKDKLNKFIKTTATVYFDLFIRLAIIYFIIFAVKEVIDSKMLENIAGNDNWFRNAIVNIAIIGGLFMFAKTAPKFISELLGLPDIGSGDMKDMFTRGGGLLGTTAAGLRTARSNYTAQKERALGKNPDGKVGARLRGALSAAAGFGSATGRGLAMTAQGKGFKDVRQGASKAALNARNRRNDRVDKLYSTGVPKYIEEDILDENGRPKLDAAGNKMTRKVKNPEYYGYMDYRRDVRREKLGIPSYEGFVKARYDAMDAIAKDAASAKSHGVGKMNETPDKYKINLSTEAGDPGKSIKASLGFDDLTMEQVRNMYQMAKNGQKITTENRDASGNRIVRNLTDDEITILGSLVQNIEKRTSYLKEAELMATGDPAATPNAEKLRIGIQTNRDMFSSQEIIGPIRTKLLKDIGNSITINGETIDITKLDYNGLVNITSHLQDKITDPVGSDAYNDTVKERANILLGLKDAFEEVSKLQYRGAQIADNRAQKAQQAINNNDKKS